MNNFQNLQRKKGISLSRINPGSEEFALSSEDAIKGITILKTANQPVFGGDVLTIDRQGNPAYIVHAWGYEYCYLNWSCEKLGTESDEKYFSRSCDEALKAIKKAREVSEYLRRPVCFALVT